MDKRLFPIPREYFDQTIKPLIEGDYIWKGRPPTISHYHVFCAILYILRTGCPWRDLPSCYGKWHPIYLRFKRGGEKGLWWRVLMKLQQGKKVTMNIVLADSTTMKIHRHGGGAKGGPGPNTVSLTVSLPANTISVLTAGAAGQELDGTPDAD